MSEKKSKGAFLNDLEQQTLKAMINATSLAAVSKECGVGEQSLTKAAAGISVQRGTVSLIRDYFRAKAAPAQ